MTSVRNRVSGWAARQGVSGWAARQGVSGWAARHGANSWAARHRAAVRTAGLRVARVIPLLPLVLAGCAGQPGADRPTEEPMLPEMSQQAAQQLVESYVVAVAGRVNPAARRENEDIHRTPCRGRNGEHADDGRFYVYGSYQLALAEGRHATVLGALRDEWRRQGYEIREFRTFGSDGVSLSARNPDDGVQLAIQTTTPPKAVAVNVFSPCVRPPVAE